MTAERILRLILMFGDSALLLFSAWIFWLYFKVTKVTDRRLPRHVAALALSYLIFVSMRLCELTGVPHDYILPGRLVGITIGLYGFIQLTKFERQTLREAATRVRLAKIGAAATALGTAGQKLTEAGVSLTEAAERSQLVDTALEVAKSEIEVANGEQKPETRP